MRRAAVGIQAGRGVDLEPAAAACAQELLEHRRQLAQLAKSIAGRRRVRPALRCGSA